MIYNELKEKYLTKNVLLSIYFIFFIILNILDFLGKLSQDLDFFKKLLSWGLIWILFYQISLTKIFIGKRVKKIDISYIIAFSILIIPKTLKQYINNIINANSHLFSEGTLNLTILLDQFVIFEIPMKIIDYSLNTFLNIHESFFLGILILIITNFVLLRHHKIEEKSFIGSLNLKTIFGHRITSHISLFFLSFFFAFVIAPFFLEWFALTVDALILILGLIYYTTQFIHKIKDGSKTSNLLKNISNSGSIFFKDLINTFSNKKTFFVGVSFLLALHLLVDIGIYMVPYLLGTSSPLYFDALDGGENNHIPLFNVFDFDNSQSYNEIMLIFSDSNNSNTFLKIIQFIFVILIYISTYFYFLILMAFPFYYIYKRIKNELITIPKYLIIFIISMSLFFVLSQDQFLNNISMPISIQTTQTIGIEGVDIQTSSIFKQGQQLTSIDFSDTISLIVFFILTFIIFIGIKYNKYKTIFSSITYLIFLIFFIFYISLFYFDLNTGIFERDHNKDNNNLIKYDYSQYLKLIQSNKIQTIPISMTIDNNLELKGKAYHGINNISFFYGKYNHEKYEVNLNNHNLWISEENDNILINLGNEKINTNNLEEIIIKSYNLGVEKQNMDTAIKKTQNSFVEVINYIAFFFSTIFYVIGMSIFTIHYIKTLRRRELN